MPVIVDPDRQKAIRDVVYEYANLVSAGELLKIQHEPPTINTHIQDAFLLSCRKMADFFSKEPAGRFKDTDLTAKSYGVPLFEPLDLPVWAMWEDAIDFQLAHVSLKRRTEGKTWDGTAVNPMLEEFRRAWRKFLGGLEWHVHAMFEAEISERLRGRGFECLDLR
jgi:hypothetical protein